MESIGAMFEGDHQWNNMNFNNEEADLMSQLMLGNCSLQNEFPITNMSNFGLFSSSTNYNSSEVTSSEMYSFSQGNSTYSCGATTNSSFFPFPLPYGPAGRYPPPMAYYSGMEGGDEFFNQDLSNDSVESSGQVAGGEDVLEGKTLHQQEMQVEDNETSKKRPRIPVDVKNKRIVKPKKNQEKLNSSEKNDNESSEDDSNGSNDELNGGSKEAKSALNLNGKTRASRGSATDPQSLYARKRRERINERLRILQTLVPNGTKVDISTMLEEAVQYVKFLQLQIKLLSSDDMWMYSPIAYNGMDIGLRLEN